MSLVLARNWWALVLRGVFAVVFGLAAFFWPGVTLAVLVMLFGVYAVVDGIFAVVAAITGARSDTRWWALLLEGIVSILAGAVAFVWPGITALVLVYLMGAWAIITGVLEAVSVVDRHIAFQSGIYAQEAIHDLVQDSRNALEAVAERARQVGVDVVTHLLHSRPGAKIIRQAERLGADLIVVGSHGQGALLDMILGSVSLYVVHHSHVPVCVVRPPRR
jgi:nucleotide-binding universal stress UspA family protein